MGFFRGFWLLSPGIALTAFPAALWQFERGLLPQSFRLSPPPAAALGNVPFRALFSGCTPFPAWLLSRSRSRLRLLRPISLKFTMLFRMGRPAGLFIPALPAVLSHLDNLGGVWADFAMLRRGLFLQCPSDGLQGVYKRVFKFMGNLIHFLAKRLYGLLRGFYGHSVTADALETASCAALPVLFSGMPFRRSTMRFNGGLRPAI